MMRFGHFLSTARCSSSANVIQTPNPGPSPVMGKGGRTRQGEVNGVKFGVDSVKVETVKVDTVKVEGVK